MRGRYCYAQGWLEGNFQERQAEARSFFERAIETNPRFAAAFAWLAIIHFAVWFSPSDSSSQALDELERAARRGVSLDPELPVAHLTLSMIHELRGKYNDAIAAARLAIELDPSFARGYLQMGFYLPQVGESDEAIAILDKGMRLSPRDPWSFEFLRAKHEAHFAAGRYEDAVECLKQSVATGRSFGGANWFALAASLAHLDRLEEAEAALHEAEKRFEWKVTVHGARRIFYYKNPEFLERWLDGLRKAGLPE